MVDKSLLRATWDGLFICDEPPYGATVLVYRRSDRGRPEFLVLHRAGAADVGDWAWGPPATTRLPGEDVASCARRQLRDDTGLRLPLRPLGVDAGWACFYAEVSVDVDLVLSAERDRYEWLALDEARRRCQPDIVGAQFDGVPIAAAA